MPISTASSKTTSRSKYLTIIQKPVPYEDKGKFLKLIEEIDPKQDPLIKQQEIERREESQFFRHPDAGLNNSVNKTQRILTFQNYLQSISVENPSDDFMIQPTMSDLLPSAVDCYLPPISSHRELTLVLDLDETLIHYEEIGFGRGRIHLRPHLDQFLQAASELFEVVIFTASMQDYADEIIDRIDEQRLISHRLYRQHATFLDDAFVKDLSKLGRCLSKTLLVDNAPHSFALQPQNGLLISSFTGHPQDDALLGVLADLKLIATRYRSDVRRFATQSESF